MSTWRLWNDARTEKKIQEDFTKLYEQPNPQKEWIKAMYEQDSTMFHHFVDTIEKWSVTGILSVLKIGMRIYYIRSLMNTIGMARCTMRVTK